MKKVSKISKLALAVLLTLSLTACGKSEEVLMLEESIATIGEVTLDKGELIIFAEQSYSLLEEKDKEDVENYDVLLSARQEFDNIGKDYLDTEKFSARATIALQNVIENKDALEIKYTKVNDKEVKYVEITAVLEHVEDGINQLAEQIFIITEDDNIITDIVAKDETKIFDILIDYETGLYVITEPLAKELNLDFETHEPVFERVSLLIERYSNTKDQEFIGLDEQTLIEFNEKAEKIELKKHTVSAIMEFYPKMELIEDLQVEAEDAILVKKYDVANAMYEDIIIYCQEILELDFSETSLELNGLKNNTAELMIESTLNSTLKIESIKKFKFAELKKLHEASVQMMSKSLENFEQFKTLYDSEFKGKIS